MSKNCEDGYLRSIEYVERYYGEFNPWLLRFIATLHGFACPNFSDGFSLCDLGCGSGMSTLVLAASNPQSHCWGVDFNSEHIRRGEEIRKKADVENCTLINEAFDALHKYDMPDMDIVIIHGVYSWISQEVKSDLHDFLRWKLKPGGMVLITYNALPGWAPLAPIRDFMREYASGSSDNALETAREGMRYLRFLAESEGAFFRQNPTAHQMLDLLEQHDIRYIAHEFFTEFWRPLYCREVSERMYELGLNFCGQLPLYLNYGEICLPESVQRVMKTAPNRTIFETHKDFVRNTMFRWDLFVKSAPKFTADSAENHRKLRFGMLKNSDQVQREMAVPGGRKITLTGKIYDYIVNFYSQNCGAMVGELLDIASNTEFKPEEIVSAVQYLTMIDALKPFAQQIVDNAEFAGLSRVNRVFADLSLFADDSVVLASPVYGAGIVASRDESQELLKKTLPNDSQNDIVRKAASLNL